MNLKSSKSALLAISSLVVMGFLYGCNQKTSEQTIRKFPSVTVPTIYTAPQAQAEYLTEHYWDQFDFADTAYIGSSAVVTQEAIADYISVLPYASYDKITQGLKQVMTKADENPAMYAFFVSQMERFLFDLNSTLRNEEFYIPVLEHMVASKSLDEPRKIRPNLLLSELQKNRPGQQATNIRFTRSSGAKDSLSNIKSAYTLLMFYNLDCGNCKSLTAAINESPVIKTLQKENKIQILAIYPGQNVEEWKSYLKEMSSSWTIAYDEEQQIANQGAYILRIIPTLYLLDKNGMVIMKDAAFNYVEYYLNSVVNPPVASSKNINDSIK